MGLGTVNTESGLIGIQKSRYDELIEVGRLHSQQSSIEKPTSTQYLEVFYAGSSLLKVNLMQPISIKKLAYAANIQPGMVLSVQAGDSPESFTVGISKNVDSTTGPNSSTQKPTSNAEQKSWEQICNEGMVNSYKPSTITMETKQDVTPKEYYAKQNILRDK